MYKTVRKGDTSLQYTILPQTDQIPSSGFPQTSGKQRPKIIKYTMAILMILIIVSCVAKDIALGKTGSRITIPTLSATEASRKKNLHDVAPTTTIRREEQTLELTSPESIVSTSQMPEDPTESSTKSRQMSTTTTTPVTSTGSMLSTMSRISSSTDATTRRTTTIFPRKMQMPRVTLRLRGNETIPHKYVSSGIASYKKDNITTSVVAHNLSLEGLIIKTPEGTIKPYPQKLFFTDATSDFQWKEMPLTIYVVLPGLAALAVVSIILTLYAQRKASRKQRQNVEEPEAGNQEEDTSTLLGTEGQEPEEKE